MPENNNDNDLWSQVVGILDADDRVQPSLMGFVNLAEVKGIIENTLYVEVPNDLARNMFEMRLRDFIHEALAQVDNLMGVTSFAVVVNSSMAPAYAPVISSTQDTYKPEAPFADPPASNTVSRGNANWDSRLTNRYTFDNFVMGTTNMFARAASFAVAESPAKAYNPLFIYGASGLGKTHLLHAIGHYALAMYPRSKVRYVSSEEFTNDFINAIQNNRSAQFLTEYRDIDFLLIDDIQFLAGKDQTQEAFFHTFNALHDANKQVVITCDVPPKDLMGFQERMLSRFSWGLMVDIQAPELETRIAILRKKAENDKIRVGDDILEYMAERVQSNVRELEGTLIRVTAYANLSRKPVDLALVQTVLKDVSPATAEQVVAPIDIINTISRYYQITPDEIYGQSRTAGIARARQIAMYLCREQTTLSLPKIGQLFGGRDHTTVMYACRKVAEWMKERRSFYNEIDEILTQIKNATR
jgi:chromosomal replication initiator protein